MSLGLAIGLVALSSLAIAILLLPLLLRRGTQAGRNAYNLAVYGDQLAEVERDVGRGLLTADQAEAARAEIGRRILTLETDQSEIAVRPKAIAAAVVAILVLPLAGLLLYAGLGAPSLPGQPFAVRAGNETTAAGGDAQRLDMQQAMMQLRTHLRQHPEDLTAWLLLGRSDVGLGDFQEGADAYRHAADLSGHRADVMSAWGEAQVLAADGTVIPAAVTAFQASLADPESAPRSRYYLALARFQHGDLKGALTDWRQLAADSPADAAWLSMVKQRIAETAAKLDGTPAPAAAMPSPAAVAATQKAVADSPPEERQAMIDAMVARLADRLKSQPGDVEGWAQLGRSYMVLNRPAEARDAFARAVKLRPGDPTLAAALAAATEAVGRTPASASAGKPTQ
jgi:cytochrome c-type biogenesis protein CcmH